MLLLESTKLYAGLRFALPSMVTSELQRGWAVSSSGLQSHQLVHVHATVCSDALGAPFLRSS